MRQLLSGLSIKLQVVVPVFFTLLLLIIGITFSTSSLKTAFHQVTVSTEQLITDKDNLTTLIDNTYAMRISAIYSLFRPAEVMCSKKSKLKTWRYYVALRWLLS